MSRHARVLAAAVASALSFGSRSAGAEGACGGPGHPGIVLRGEGIAPQLRAQIAAQLRAALAERSFELCEPADAAGAVAELDVTNLATADVALTLAVRDEITDKRVSRDIDLHRIPEDGRGLVIAQAADELLRASWAELLVPDAPKPRREVPPEVARALPAKDIAQPPVEVPSRPPVVELGAALAVERFGSGLTQVGLDVAVGIFPLPRFGAVARAGLRSGSRAEAPSGAVDPTGLALALAVVAGVVPRTGRLGLDAGAELFVTRVHYAAEASAGARASSESGTAIYASAVARGWTLLVAPVRASLGLSLGAPIRTVRAVAAGETIASVAGVLVAAELGVGAAW